MSDASSTTATPHIPFGSLTAVSMAVARTEGGAFGSFEVTPVEAFSIHPSMHALHYGSSCFEGLKAHRGTDGVVRLFRLEDHVRRMRASAEALCLPVPDAELVRDMIRATVRANLDEVPEAPGALYVRPVLLGTDLNIGAAAHRSQDALFYVLGSPVGSYFAGGEKALTVALETGLPRSTPQFGGVKTGANYAMALGTLERARAAGADQVLFAPEGDVQETGASNFLLFTDGKLVARPPGTAILAGVTRDSVLELARSLGHTVEEREITVEELLAAAPRAEAMLSGTAAVLTGVGTIIHEGREIPVGDGDVGPTTVALREALTAVHLGEAEDRWGWTEVVEQPA